VEKKRIFFVVAVFVVFLITAVSFLVRGNISGRSANIVETDKAALAYTKAEEYLKAGEQGKAVDILTMVIDRYPDSGYAETSLRRLAGIHFDNGDYTKAKYYNNRLLEISPGIKGAQKIRSTIEELNMKIMQLPAITAGSTEYTVQPGDTLTVIAKKFNTTVALIKKINGLKSDMIRSGQKLKINTSTFSIHVDKTRNILLLKKDGIPFKTYKIATGKDNSTPTGVFTIVDKMVKPPWTKPGVGVIMPDSDEYELGERWMPISAPGYGIHGTNDESSIGKQSTAGCIRMHNDDVIELYDIVPRGTEVEIVDSAVGKEGV
jgi:lipoprotein-anchoring transpeptidase ErfK/SrfK